MSELGLILALGCALISGVALLCKHRGAVNAPDVAMRSPLRSASALFRSRWWAIGFGLAFCAWCLHVVALSMAPLSLVQAVIAGGLAMLAIPARRWFGIAVCKREMAGIGLCAAGLGFLALTAGHARSGIGFDPVTMLGFQCGMLTIGGLLILTASNGRLLAQGSMLMAIAAGTLLGVSDISLKALAELVPADPIALLSPWTLTAVLGGLGAFLALGRGLQIGEPVAVIVAFSAAATLGSIAGGIVVFGDPMGSDAVAVIGRSLAFVAVVGAAALLPMVPRQQAAAPRSA